MQSGTLFPTDPENPTFPKLHSPLFADLDYKRDDIPSLIWDRIVRYSGLSVQWNS
ncbi:hypothetical protein EYZ11_010972 [Aspergillus tanneri]|uniref:Uncharacterized protein n=1 Tax=Aspergillus tanneri TaxID=1220188 RepID=A0A4S3J654_9EURO|nr:hypothetical protein EYZ11_010972 [Aspergillus tanneri]